MRDVFEQYDQPENKLTHALVCALDADRSPLMPFVAWLGANCIPKDVRSLKIVEQQLPGELVLGDEDIDDCRGLPDAVIHDGDFWAVLIEAKIQSPVTADQLRRDRASAGRQGFKDAQLFVLSVEGVPVRSCPFGARLDRRQDLHSP